MSLGDITDFTGAHRRPANYINVCRTLADSYPFGVGHGVQKDAIQNSVDAKRGEGPVEVEFSLVMGKRHFLCITDRNTKGLGGPFPTGDAHYEEDLPEDHDWARFESFAFTKESPDAIGARGQGKFIFLNASKKYLIYYDTRLPSGEYRAGATMAQTNDCPVLRWREQEAREEINRRLGLDPISHVGTRIIIVDPTDEVCDFIRSRKLEEAVQETWFRCLEEGSLRVYISFDDIRKEVELPWFYPLPNADDELHASWVLRDDFTNDVISVRSKEKHKVRAFRAVVFKNQVIPEQFRGIAVIHNGMKIEALEPPSLFPEQITQRLTGFIEFDRELDRELRKGENQLPNHYELNWRRRWPRAIKDYVNRQMDEFGRRKLGLGSVSRDFRQRKLENAAEAALRELMKYAHDMDLFGALGGPKMPSKTTTVSPHKEVGVQISNFVFPDPTIAPRIERGSEFKEIVVSAFNKTEKELEVALSVYVLRGDTCVLRIREHRHIQLSGHKKASTEPFDLRISETAFNQPGEYRLRATLVHVATGYRLDEVTKRFWVDANPPYRKPFDHRSVVFPEPFAHLQWTVEGSINNSPVLNINTGHTAYRVAENEGDEALHKYLVNVMLEGAIAFFFTRPETDSGMPDYHPLRTEKILGNPRAGDPHEIPRRTYEEVCSYLGLVRSRMYKGK